MKIIYFHQYFTFPNESGGTRSYDLAKSFCKQGLEVVVVSSTSDRKYKNRNRWNVLFRDGLEVHYIYLPYGNHLNYFERILVFIRFMYHSIFRLLKIKSDILLATSTPLTIGIPALLKKVFQRTPFIFEVRDVWPEAVIAIGAIKNKLFQKLLYYLEYLIYKNASAIVPLSTDMQRSIVLRYPQFKEKAGIVIENISEVDRFQNINIASKPLEELVGFKPRFAILYAGTFGKVNGIDYVIELASLTLKYDPMLVYILIGDGIEKKNILELANQNGVLNKNVFILDSVSKDDLPSWYQSVEMGSSFVIDVSELWANSANKFFDTLAAGKPILINHSGWQAVSITKANYGYQLPAQLTEKAAKEFLDYTQDTNLYKIQSTNALQHAKDKYSLEVATEKYLNVINRIKKYV